MPTFKVFNYFVGSDDFGRRFSKLTAQMNLYLSFICITHHHNFKLSNNKKAKLIVSGRGKLIDRKRRMYIKYPQNEEKLKKA